ncbi:hypothetical protein [Bdellovibrio sp. HCB209]|uniref:hypothetical protein n=1 Tax=Bdellovibrio sp. HCB209 TaxID=3394354 RepID=UPI0039B3A903
MLKVGSKSKLKIGLSAFTIILLIGAASFLTNTEPLGAELPLNLRVGMSSKQVSKSLGVDFKSLTEAKQTIRLHEYHDFDANEYLQKIGDLVLTDAIKSTLTSKYASVVFRNERTLVKMKFYKDELYDIQFEFDLSNQETLSKGDEIKNEVLSKYISAKVEKAETIDGAYSVKWSRDGMNASLWVNPKDRILTLQYWDFSVFKEALDQQRASSEKGTL